MGNTFQALLLPLLTPCRRLFLSRGVNRGSNCEVQLYSSDHTSFSSFHFRCLLTETWGTWPQTQGSVLALCDGK